MILTIGAVREEDIIFSATGHDHSGGVNGENVPEAAVVFSAAGHTHVGGVQGNTLGLDALKVDEQSAENAGAVTVTALGVAIVSLPSMTVAVGDRVLVYASLLAVKGATAGDDSVWVSQAAGTAVGTFLHNYSILKHIESVLASGNLAIVLAGVFKITGAGTLTLRLDGDSAGSDSTVSAGAADIHALVLRGTG